MDWLAELLSKTCTVKVGVRAILVFPSWGSALAVKGAVFVQADLRVVK